MKKTLLASAMALTMGSAASVQAQTITITQMIFGGSYAAAGTMNSNGDGHLASTVDNLASTVDNFSGFPWVADQQAWFDTHSSTLTWSGTGTQDNTANANFNFTHTFHLESNQVAVGMYWDWHNDNNIPILTIYDCPETGGGACNGTSLAMAGGTFSGATPRFDGTTLDDFPVSGVVPVPAAAWLMGSGLIGLVGVARRKRS